MQLTGNGYQLDCDMPDFTIGYFKSKKKYHYYNEDTEEYYGNDISIHKEKNESNEYVPCDGRVIKVRGIPCNGRSIGVKDQFTRYLSLPDKVAKVNEEMQKYCEKEVNYIKYSINKIYQLFDKMTMVCMKYEMPRNIILQYYQIILNQTMKYLGPDGQNEVYEVYNTYVNNIRE